MVLTLSLFYSQGPLKLSEISSGYLKNVEITVEIENENVQ
ncbi:hypothetical protein T06_2257 [Trichinella sp. T6]|nr:hypothetical protein T06_2257 [Trichinella sp. T6]